MTHTRLNQPTVYYALLHALRPDDKNNNDDDDDNNNNYYYYILCTHYMHTMYTLRTYAHTPYYVASFRGDVEVRSLAQLTFDADSRVDACRIVQRFELIGATGHCLCSYHFHSSSSMSNLL